LYRYTKAAELPAGSALKMVRVRSAEVRRRLDPLDHAAGPGAASTASIPPGYHGGYGTDRPGSSSSRPGSRGSVVEHVVISSQQLHRTGDAGGSGGEWGGQTSHQHHPRPPGMPPTGPSGGSSRPSSRGGGAPPTYPRHAAAASDGAADLELLPPAPAGYYGGGGGMDELEEMGGGGMGYLRGTGAGTATAMMDEEDAEYFPPGWESGRRGDADVLSLAPEDGIRGGGGGGSGGGGGYGGGDKERTTRGGVQIVNETVSLLDGDFDEGANEASFADALKEWRSGGRDDPGRPTTASLATMEVQTESPANRAAARPQTARPGAVVKSGASYFERMYAANVERMAAKDAMDALSGKRPSTASASARPASGGM
jgi:hypothetical protein